MVIDVDFDGRKSFYYNPYSGELSLDFPQASKRCRGGILADGALDVISSERSFVEQRTEMGLGKTIMLAGWVRCLSAVRYDDRSYTASSTPIDLNGKPIPTKRAPTTKKPNLTKRQSLATKTPTFPRRSSSRSPALAKHRSDRLS